MTKLKFYGIVEAARVKSQALDLDLVSTELEVTKVTLNKWLTELKTQADSKTVLDCADAKDQNSVYKAPEDDLDHSVAIIDGKIVVVDEVKAKELSKAKEAKAIRADKFKAGVTGLQLLSSELQSTAGTLVTRIADLADEDPSARDIASLTSALTNIQQAFFNKPVTNVQVNTMTTEGTSMLSKFRNNLQA